MSASQLISQPAINHFRLECDVQFFQTFCANSAAVDAGAILGTVYPQLDLMWACYKPTSAEFSSFERDSFDAAMWAACREDYCDEDMCDVDELLPSETSDLNIDDYLCIEGYAAESDEELIDVENVCDSRDPYEDGSVDKLDSEPAHDAGVLSILEKGGKSRAWDALALNIPAHDSGVFFALTINPRVLSPIA
jgi:hypothetical protein